MMILTIELFSCSQMGDRKKIKKAMVLSWSKWGDSSLYFHDVLPIGLYIFLFDLTVGTKWLGAMFNLL